jgi:hypothetical protein
MADFENSKSELLSLQSTAVELWKADKQSAKELGEALVKVREAMRVAKGPTFGSWLEENGIPQNRASYCMRVATGKVDKAKKQTQKADSRTYTLPPDLNSAVVSLACAWKTTPAALVNEILTEYVTVYAGEVIRGRTLHLPVKPEEPRKPGSVAVNTVALKRKLKFFWRTMRRDSASANARFFTDADGVRLAVEASPTNSCSDVLDEASASGTVNLTIAFKDFKALMDRLPSKDIITIEPGEASEHITMVKHQGEEFPLPARVGEYLFTDDLYYGDNWSKSGMPDYASNDLKPHQTLKVHFANEADVQKFGKLVDQKLTEKTRSIRFPEYDRLHVADKAYVVDGKLCNPEYPVYIISKGRSEKRHTAKSLDAMRVPYHIVIEQQEYDKYAAVIDPKKILTLPIDFREKAPRGDEGSIPARNWVWEHSKSLGAERHWILDDNINGFYRLHNNVRIPVLSGAPFKAAEDFVNQFDNVGLAGFNYFMFAKASSKLPPFYLNSHI